MRGPIHMSIDITNQCNLRCLHCYNNSGESRDCELSDSEMLALVSDIRKMKPSSLCFCGGEPLLRSSLLCEAAESLTAAGINCSVVSNGWLINQEMAESIKSAGIGVVQISLDGDKESHDKLRNREGAYEKAINAIEVLRNQNIEVGIAFSPTIWGINQFSHVYSVANQMGCFEIRVQELMPLGRGYLNNAIMPSDIQYRILRKELLEKEVHYMKGMSKVKVVWGDPIDHLICLTEQILPNKYISIRSNGDITASMYIPMVIGNVREKSIIEWWKDSLSDIWSNEKIYNAAKQITSVRKMNPTNYHMPNIFLEPDIRVNNLGGCEV